MPTPTDLLAGKPLQWRRDTLFQVCHSPGQIPPLIFLHGGLGNRYNWRFQYEFAVDQGWEAVAYDLAGHGQSQPYSRYSIGRHCRDLTRLLRHLKIQHPVLCCHSYGVPIGLEWTRQHSAKALILIAGGTHDLAPWWEIPLMKLLKWGGRHLYHLPLLQFLTQKVSTVYKHTRIAQFFAESPVPTELDPYQALEIFWNYNFFSGRQGKAHFQNLPVLVISGGQDPMFTEQMGQELAAHFPRGQHLHLPDVGHLMIAETPEVINNAIANFLGQIS
jgi:pimeloyl-ACP methyl ester carboxylesterase